MSKRDHISEILEKKRRSSNNLINISAKLTDLSISYQKTTKTETSPITSLYVVGLASCIETSVRSAIKQLIDFGPPYSEKISELLEKEHQKFPLEWVKAINSKTISFGELTSHLIPANNIAQIIWAWLL